VRHQIQKLIEYFSPQAIFIQLQSVQLYQIPQRIGYTHLLINKLLELGYHLINCEGQREMQREKNSIFRCMKKYRRDSEVIQLSDIKQ
jgi:hypothetical protein